MAPSVALLLLGSLIFLVTFAVPPVTALLLLVGVIWQSVGGGILWKRVRPSSGHLETLGMGIALGTALAALAGVVTATIGLGPWGALVPTALIVIGTLLQSRKTPTRKYETPSTQHVRVDRHVLVAFLATLALGLAIIIYSLRLYPLAWEGTWAGYHPDMPFFEAISHSLAREGAFTSPFIAEGILRYHWLSYAWAGQLSVMAQADPFIALTRLLPLTTLVGSAALVVGWTRRLSRVSWTPLLAGALLTLGGFTGAVFGGILTMDSPSQSMSALWLIGFSILIIAAIRRARLSLNLLLLIFLMTFALMGGKVSAAAPAVAGVLVMAFVLARQHTTTWPRALTLSGVTALGAAIAFAFFIAGANGGGGLTLGSLIDKASSQQGLNPLDGPRGVILGTVILVLAVLPRWAGITWLIVSPRWRHRPETWYSFGLLASSLGAIIAFNGFNEIWFSVTVSAPLAVTSAVGVGLAGKAFAKGGIRRPQSQGLALLLASAITVVVVVAAWNTGASGGNLFVPTLRWGAPILAFVLAVSLGWLIATWNKSSRLSKATAAATVIILVLSAVPGRLLAVGTNQAGYLTNGIRSEWFSTNNVDRTPGIDQVVDFELSSEELEAATWLRENAVPTDIIATNVTLSPQVSALTHMPTFVSGILYQGPYGRPSLFPQLLKNERDSWAFIDSPSQSSPAPLCEGRVTWLWIDPQRTESRNWAPYASVVSENDTVILARLQDSVCQ
jgi:hypothetical protein